MGEKKQYTQDFLNKTLWEAADSSRGTIDAGVFKDYVLLFLFYKYISDLHDHTVEKLKERYGSDKERIKLRLKNERFIVPDGCSFGDIYKHINADDLGVRLNTALHAIEDENGERLSGIVTVDFNSEAVLGNTVWFLRTIDLNSDYACHVAINREISEMSIRDCSESFLLGALGNMAHSSSN